MHRLEPESATARPSAAVRAKAQRTPRETGGAGIPESAGGVREPLGRRVRENGG